LHGAAVGMVYFGISAALFQHDFAWSELLAGPLVMKGMWSTLSGAVGGVVGINL